MKKDTAEKLISAGIQAGNILNDALYDVRDELTAEELQGLRRFLGETLGLITDHIYNPLFLEFPDLAPPAYKKAPEPPKSSSTP